MGSLGERKSTPSSGGFTTAESAAGTPPFREIAGGRKLPRPSHARWSVALLVIMFNFFSFGLDILRVEVGTILAAPPDNRSEIERG